MTAAGNWESRLASAITDHVTEPWFPGLARELVDDACQRLLVPLGLTLETYGTNRFLRHSAVASRDNLYALPTRTGKQIVVEHLEPEAFARYRALGLRQLTKPQIAKVQARATLERAFRYLDAVPTLRDSVETLVRCIHFLDAGDDSLDVSHSDPEVPFSIFLSVPRECVRNAPLRLCESIVHESMHLQLTLIESVAPLTRQSRNRYFSPWKKSMRDARGILHALYVFRAIEVSFARFLGDPNLSPTVVSHGEHRRRDIRDELELVRDFRSSADLSDSGKLLAEMLIE